AALSGFESDQSYSSFRKGLLEEGLKAEISYQFRLYKRNKSFFSFLGDKVITEKKIIKTAYLDIYERVFIIEVNEEKKVLLYEEDFLRSFFKAEDIQIGRLSSRESKEHYVLARISFSPVRLAPPLNMISLLYKKTAVIEDHPLNNSQTQPGSILFGSEIGVKNVFPYQFINAFTGIPDPYSTEGSIPFFYHIRA
ncbi:unnamed protein product, partial [marine sediment metagenome]